MVRFGFGRIDSINDEQVTVYYAPIGEPIRVSFYKLPGT